MTKVTGLGQEPKEEKKLKPISFVYFLDGNGKTNSTSSIPSQLENIELISKRYRNRKYDLIFCHRGSRNGASDGQQGLYLGHFNDGIV